MRAVNPPEWLVAGVGCDVLLGMTRGRSHDRHIGGPNTVVRDHPSACRDGHIAAMNRAIHKMVPTTVVKNGTPITNNPTPSHKEITARPIAPHIRHRQTPPTHRSVGDAAVAVNALRHGTPPPWRPPSGSKRSVSRTTPLDTAVNARNVVKYHDRVTSRRVPCGPSLLAM